MKLEKNRFCAGLAAQQRQIGLWLSLSSNFAAEVVAPSGYDWVMLDMEHSPNSLNSILGQLQVFSAYSTTPLVRPPWNDPVLVKRLLDLGVPGLLFPMIQSVDEAKKAVASTLYPPRGVRGVSATTRATKFGRVTDYAARIADETAILLQLETAAAVALAQDIAAVDGVDGIFFGPADIAADIGLMGQPLNDAVWNIIMPAAQNLIEKGVPVGTLVSDPIFAQRLFDEGFSYVACGIDTALLAASADALLAKFR